MTVIDNPARSTSTNLFDTEAISAELVWLGESFSGRERELRTAVAQRLKAALADAHVVAEQLLLEDRRGRACAE